MFETQYHFAQAAVAATNGQEETLINTLKSSEASLKDKVDACRQLARIGTEKAVPVLAGLLGEDKLSHMARYAMETLPHPSVDKVLREALTKLKGRHLVGVIGSIGVRRDANAVKPLSKFLLNDDIEVAQAAARALGSIGTADVIPTFFNAKPNVPKSVHPHLYEGLLRCAERLEAEGYCQDAYFAYDRMMDLSAPHQIRTAALRGAVLLRGNDGIPLLMDALKDAYDYALVQAAAHIAQEMPGSKISKVLANELKNLPPDKKILVIQTLGLRADEEAVPALIELTKNGEKQIRIEAIRALGDITHPDAKPVLKVLVDYSDTDIAEAAKMSLSAIET